jgi:TetR/AcrR family transcriptional regulator, regulator of autoinduction and epiphytic fitness
MRASKSQSSIVAAAVVLFRKFGVKRTNMNQIAIEAGVSRATLYGHFKDKEDIFVSVAQETCDRILESTKSAKSESGSLQDALERMLEAKFTLLFNLMVQTPHAIELMETQLRLCGAIVLATDEAYLKLLEDRISSAQRKKEIVLSQAGFNVASAAQWLMTSARGADTDAKNENEHRAHLSKVVQVFLKATQS